MALGAEVFRLFGSIGVDTSEAERSLDSVARHGRNAAEDLDNNSGNKIKSFGAKSALVMGAIAGVAQAAFNKIASVVTSTISSAIKRVDTLNNANLVFKNMGFTADATKTMMDRLLKSIQGLPTPLDAAIRGVQSLAATSGDIVGAQKVFSALNDGILAFGGSAEMVDGAILQLSQLPMDGPLDAQTWNSLRQNGMTPVFAAMAKESGMSVNKLKEAFGSGKLTVADFTDMLIKMDEKGGGGMASLQKQAHDATKGISTGWANMQTAITRGVADIIQSIGSENISKVISDLGSKLESFLKNLGNLIQFIVDHKDIFGTLAVGIGTAAAAMAAYSAYVKVSTALTAAYTAVTSYLTLVQSLQAKGLGGLRAAWRALNIAMRANPIGFVITAVVALTAALVWFFTKTDTGKKILQSFINAMKTAWEWIATTGIKVWDDIKNAIGNALDWIKNTWDTTWSAIKAVLETVWGWIETFLTIAVGIPLAIINTLFLSPLLALWNVIWGAIKTVFTTVWNALVAFLTPIIEAIKSVISVAFNFIKTVITAELEGIKTVVTTVWNFIISAITTVVNAIKSVVTSVWNAISSATSSVWNDIKNITTSVWNGIKDAISGPITAAFNFVKSMIDKIKGLFHFNISWPHVPMPHFSITPSGWKIGDLLKGKIPKLGINWYAKGGIMDGPTLFGLNGSNLMGGGEAGREAILPLNRDNLGMIGDGIAQTMDSNDSGLLKALLAELKQLREDQKNLSVIMDSGELVGSIRKQLDQALQNDAILRRRGVTV